jgi:phosphoglucomutase
VFTPIHGTGSIMTVPMLKRLGFPHDLVPEQERQDGRFPTVDSPNPENAEALDMAMKRADETNANLVAATDPDADRMGIAARGRDGKLHLLTGNQIGSLLCWYRTKTLFDQGVLTDQNKGNACLIKTFVTTDLQKAIAESYGLACVETLTGFKYIGAKLSKYESQLPEDARKNYLDLSEEETRKLRLEHSTFFVCGGEESYGYLGADFVRDKDANMSVVMIAEVAMYADSQGLTLPELMDQLYQEFGYYTEKNRSIYMEGAEGASKIKRLIRSYSDAPPENLAGMAVEGIKNYGEEDFRDIEGDPIPKERMLIFDLTGGFKVAVRPSGTEPKIKYYLFGVEKPPEGGKLSPTDLEAAKERVRGRIDEVWETLRKDAEDRLT